MITLREAASGLLEAVESAIESGDWKVDGACDPAVEIIRLKNALTNPKVEWVGLTHAEVDSWELPDCPTVFEFAQFIEAKLKEKNNV